MATTYLESVSTLDLLAELKRRYQCITRPELRLVFLGAPGCGKGTQSAYVCNKYCVCHISTGEMLRGAVKSGGEIGKEAKAKMESGQLVSDDIVMKLIQEKMAQPQCQRGFILDGYPRNVNQAENLNKLLAKNGQRLDGVFYFGLTNSILKDRVCGRMIHPASGRIYHSTFHPPKRKDFDDVTGEHLIHRKDDNEETFIKRLSVFHKETEPLISFYHKLGLLRKLDAAQSPNTVSSDIESEVIKAKGGSS